MSKAASVKSSSSKKGKKDKDKKSKKDKKDSGSSSKDVPPVPIAAPAPAPSPAKSTASNGSSAQHGGGAADPASVAFLAGRLWADYTGNSSNYLDRRAFMALCRDLKLHDKLDGRAPSADGARTGDPSPRTAFDAGMEYTRYAGGGAVMEKRQFEAFVRERLQYGEPLVAGPWGPHRFSAAPAPPVYPPAQHYQPPWSSSPSWRPSPPMPPASSGDMSFEAGRRFALADANRDDKLSPQEFARAYADMRRAPSDARHGRGPHDVRNSLAPRYGAPSSSWQAPVGAVGMYGGHLSTMDAYRARMSDMTALTASLMVKREQMMQQLSKVQLHAEHVKAARRAIERETIADAEGILHRLRSAEAFKLSLLQHDIDELSNDISAVDNFHAQFSAYQPRPGPGPMYSDVDSRTAMEFLSRYPELCGEADRLATKVVKMTVDVAVDDFERETAKRLHALQQFQAVESLLEDRENAIAALDAENERTRSDMLAMTSHSQAEHKELWDFASKVVQQLEAFRMRCDKCHVRLLDTTVNTDCEVARASGPGADGPDGNAGAGAGAGAGSTDTRHKWVPVAQAGSGDELLKWFE